MANINVPVSIRYGRLPINFSPTAASYVDALQKRITMSLSSDNVLIGNTDSPELTYNRGPQIGADHAWKYWDDTQSRYVAVKRSIQNGANMMTFAGSPTAGRTVTFPNASGTVANTVDIYAPRTTQVIDTSVSTGSATPSADLSTGDSWIINLRRNIVLSLTGYVNGTVSQIAAINTSSSYQIVWPSFVVWPTGTTGVTSQTASAVTSSGNTITVTVPSTAAFAVGQGVTISGATGMTNINGLWQVASVPTGTTFTAVVSSTPSGAYTASSATVATGPTQPVSLSTGDNATAVYILRASDVRAGLKLYGEYVKGYSAMDATSFTPGGPSSVSSTYGIISPNRTQSTIPQ